MKAGDLRYTVTLQSRVSTQDSFGQPSLAWQDVATVRAAIEPLSGRELIAAQELMSETTTRVRIRYLPGVTAAMRVAFADAVDGLASTVYYNIQQIVDVTMRHRELQLMCSSGLTDG